EFPDRESEPRMFRFNNLKFASWVPWARLTRIGKFDRRLTECISKLFHRPNWVLRPRIRSRRDPLRVKQCGTTWRTLPKFW
ncbi:hypothetical protein Prudu_016889, partial [Prunus dulcis]